MSPSLNSNQDSLGFLLASVARQLRHAFQQRLADPQLTLAQARALNAGVEIQIEVETLAQLKEALECGATSVLLDNFELAAMREAVALNAGRAELEVSGGVQLEQLRDIAATGVDRISVGALTKNVQAVDLSMRIVERL